MQPKDSYVFDRQPMDEDLDVRENETIQEHSIGWFFKKFGWKGALPPILLGIGMVFWQSIKHLQIRLIKENDPAWSWMHELGWGLWSGNSNMIGENDKSKFAYTTSCFGSLIGTGVVVLFHCRNRVRNFTVLYSVLMVIGMLEFVLITNTAPWWLVLENFVVGFSDS
jgi:hypothetical protein